MEVGPEGVAEVKLRVGALPEEVVAESDFPARADEQVGVGHEGRGEVLGNEVLVDVGGVELALGRLPGEVAYGFGDFPAGAVAQGYDHGHPRVHRSALLEAQDGLAHHFGHAGEVADDAQAHVVVHEEFLLERGEDERHECGHLVGRAVPVFGRERVEGEELHAQVGAGRGDFLHGHDALLVAHAAVHSARLRPTAVAVHDDGDVAGYVERTFFHLSEKLWGLG